MDIKFCKTNLSLSTRSWMGDSNSSSHIHWWTSKLLLPNPELTTGLGVRTLTSDPLCSKDEPLCCGCHKRIGLLQKFNKWQGKAIEKMQKSMDKMVSKIKSLEKKVSGSSSKKKKSKAPTFPRSRSLLTTPRRLPAQEPHRASSFEPREGEDNTQRRRKTSKARRSSSTTGLDRVQTEETQLDRAEGRADLEEPLFENRIRVRSTQYQDFSQTMDPYNSSSKPAPPRPRKPHHFEDEEEEEESRKLDRVSRNPVAWSAPDGRLHLQTTT
ncbi:unnamed protein product [Microthlaspi erraticum]|uniref:Uncharacterized protein n=1 Tax=Microthlaspi erraticum TaxID=1685480 RepID=A0A6D2HRK0_9BRAS|nr:unnamed protein product [Microthlaspi erraticum]